MERLKEQWQSYVQQVMPETAGPVQYQETRRAFYAGAQALFSILTDGISEGGDVTKEDEELLKGIHREREQFYKDVKQGRT